MIQTIKNKFKAWKQDHQYNADCLTDILNADENNKRKIEREIHDTYYSHLLFDYITNIRKTLKQKRRLKICFFSIIMTIFILTFYCFYHSMKDIISLVKNNKESIELYNQSILIELITIIVPPLLSLIVAFIKIPEIIAKYLFNPKEDESMTSIIKNLQVYDKSIYSIENKIEEKLKNRDTDNDDTIEDFPDNAS